MSDYFDGIDEILGWGFYPGVTPVSSSEPLPTAVVDKKSRTMTFSEDPIVVQVPKSDTASFVITDKSSTAATAGPSSPSSWVPKGTVEATLLSPSSWVPPDAKKVAEQALLDMQARDRKMMDDVLAKGRANVQTQTKSEPLSTGSVVLLSLVGALALGGVGALAFTGSRVLGFLLGSTAGVVGGIALSSLGGRRAA